MPTIVVILSLFNSLLIRECAMPRKRPGTIRQGHAHRSTWRTVPHVSGLPASAQQQEVSQIELRTSRDWARFGLWPGAVAEALAAWSATSRDPAAHHFHPCACCGRSSRALLQEALDQLSGPSATALATLVNPLDEEYKSALAALISLIAAGDERALRADPKIRIRGSDPLLWVRAYPATLTVLPPEGWDLADAIELAAAPGTWSVVVPSGPARKDALTYPWKPPSTTVTTAPSPPSTTSTPSKALPPRRSTPATHPPGAVQRPTIQTSCQAACRRSARSRELQRYWPDRAG